MKLIDLTNWFCFQEKDKVLLNLTKNEDWKTNNFSKISIWSAWNQSKQFQLMKILGTMPAEISDQYTAIIQTSSSDLLFKMQFKISRMEKNSSLFNKYWLHS